MAQPSAAPGSAASGLRQPAPDVRQLGSRLRYLDDFGAAGDGATDDSRAWVAAFGACASDGGGNVHLGAKRYRIAANVTIPHGCRLICDSVALGNPSSPDYQHALFTILLAPTATITMKAQSGWSGCSVINSDVNHTPVSTRDELDLVKSFAGTGIILDGADIELDKAAILGFAVAVSSGERNHTARLHMSDVNMDGIACLQHYRSYDVSHLRSLHCFPFLSAANGNARVDFGIADVRAGDRGSYVVTLAKPAPVVEGDTVWISNCAANGCKPTIGAQSIRNRWIATVIDPRHIELRGSSATGATITATAQAGEYTLDGVQPADFPKIGIGDRITGQDLPVGTRIAYKWPRRGIIGLTAPGKATGVFQYQISDDPYVSGGTLWLDAEQRAGIAFDFLDSATTTCTDCFELGHYVGFHLGAGNEGQSMDWFSALGPQCDQINSLQDPRSTCIVIDGNSTGSSWVGGASQSVGSSIVVDTTAAGPHSFTGMQLNINAGGEGAILELDRGSVTMIGDASPPARFPIFVAETAGTLVAVGNNLANRYLFSSSRARSKLVAAANVTAPGDPQSGEAVAEHPIGTVAVASGGIYQLEANTRSQIIRSVADLAALTLEFPSISVAGQQLDIFFNHAIERLLLVSGAPVSGLPAAIKANTWHHCQAETRSGPWYCN